MGGGGGLVVGFISILVLWAILSYLFIGNIEHHLHLIILYIHTIALVFSYRINFHEFRETIMK